MFQTVKKDAFGFFQETPISIFITSDYFDLCVSRMSENIQKLYDPVLKYTCELESQFYSEYEVIKAGAIKSEEDLSFEMGCKLIDHYKGEYDHHTQPKTDTTSLYILLLLFFYLKT